MALPIEACLPDIKDALQTCSRLVIQAPPGAGKTTMVPLALLQSSLTSGRILLIQPRRLAVYGAAYRMAALCEEQPGRTIAYTTRYDRKSSSESRIEVVTEGIFLRMIQQDPELEGVDAVIFDEFHERSVSNDLALAFALESQAGFRDDDQPLKLLIMSATLDGNRLAEWLDAPLIQSEGRMFPVTVSYHPKPAQIQSMEAHIARLVVQALQQHDGSLLVFLPGMKEINRVSDQLGQHSLPADTETFKLHSTIPHDLQQRAIAPPEQGVRKIVLTTNVAETSVTIEGIRVVIDSGLVRISRYDERKGMNVLVTEKISAASAEQRRGRAGRVMEGACYRAWSETEQQQLKAFTEPEILSTDLLPVALEMAIWGCTEPTDLQLLTLPDSDAFKRARQTLADMDALHGNGVITPVGRRMAQLGIHPRLALLIVISNDPEQQSAAIAAAAILSEGDPLRFHGQWPQSDLRLRLGLWQSTESVADLQRGNWQRIKKLARQLSQRASCDWRQEALENAGLALGLAHAFPDRIAQLRQNSLHRYVMANGKGVQLNPEDQLAGTPYLVVLDASGTDREPFIRLAFAIDAAQLEDALGTHFTATQEVRWNKKKQAAESLATLRFHHLIIEQKPVSPDDPEALSCCLLEGIRQQGLSCLPWTEADTALRNRIDWLKNLEPQNWPDWNNAALQDSLEEWLLPFLAGMQRLSELQQLNLSDALLNQLSREQKSQLDRLAPPAWHLPTGHKRMINYDSENGPVVSAKMQELYGLNQHPEIGKGIPLLIEILSPANRPIQITRDLPGFWQGSYSEVTKEMRGRYPKHYWPENPESAQATTKTKRHL